MAWDPRRVSDMLPKPTKRLSENTLKWTNSYFWDIGFWAFIIMVSEFWTVSDARADLGLILHFESRLLRSRCRSLSHYYVKGSWMLRKLANGRNITRLLNRENYGISGDKVPTYLWSQPTCGFWSQSDVPQSSTPHGVSLYISRSAPISTASLLWSSTKRETLISRSILHKLLITFFILWVFSLKNPLIAPVRHGRLSSSVASSHLAVFSMGEWSFDLIIRCLRWRARSNDYYCSRYDTGTISGIIAMPYWQDTFSTGYRDSTGHLNITSSQTSAIVSILSAGTFFGALCAAPIGDIIGRRWGLIASNGVFALGVALQTAATAIPIFLAGRFFAGFGVGLISALG